MKYIYLKLIHIFILATIILTFSRPLYAYNDNDFQYWPQVGLKASLAKRWKLTADTQFRFGNNASDLYNTFAEVGGKYAPYDFFSAGLSFRYSYTKGSNGTLTAHSEYRPIIIGWLSHDFGPVKLVDRSRFEYRATEIFPNTWWYRNRLDIILPIILQSVELRPYIANEIFVNLTDGTFPQNRLYAGFRFSIVENFETDFYYNRFFLKANKWKAYNVFGTIFRLVF